MVVDCNIIAAANGKLPTTAQDGGRDERPRTGGRGRARKPFRPEIFRSPARFLLYFNRPRATTGFGYTRRILYLAEKAFRIFPPRLNVLTISLPARL